MTQWDELKQREFDNIVISPGPGRPENPKDFGICRQAINNAQVPLLGVCLGHRGLGYGYVIIGFLGFNFRNKTGVQDLSYAPSRLL